MRLNIVRWVDSNLNNPQKAALLVTVGICFLLLWLHNPFGGYDTEKSPARIWKRRVWKPSTGDRVEDSIDRVEDSIERLRDEIIQSRVKCLDYMEGGPIRELWGLRSRNAAFSCIDGIGELGGLLIPVVLLGLLAIWLFRTVEAGKGEGHK